MSPFVLNQYQETFTKPDISIIQFIREQSVQKQTEIQAIPEPEKEHTLTTRLGTAKEENEFTISNQTNPPFSPFVRGFSDTYIEHNVSVVLTSLIEDLSEWESLGTDDSLTY